MKIGYPCLNHSVGCSSNKTFRLKSYNQERFIQTVKSNLECLQKILEFNLKHNLLFFRISSDIIPFASHPILDIDWPSYFKAELKYLGDFILKYKMRISMHPDQFVVLNSTNPLIVKNSISELEYHAKFLDSLALLEDAKIQIHIGGVYDNKQNAIERFINIYNNLSLNIKKRLVIENDDRLYSLQDVLNLHKIVGIPIVFDTLHFACLNNGEKLDQAVKSAAATWKKADGILMVDFSTQEPGARIGKHSKTLDIIKFKDFINLTKDIDFDVMLEVKDKEKSALKALEIL